MKRRIHNPCIFLSNVNEGYTMGEQEYSVLNSIIIIHLTQVLLNPLYELNTPIESPLFNSKVKALAKKYLA